MRPFLWQLITVCALFPTAQLRADLPNIVLILLDDAGYGDFSCYDSSHLKTPHIDQLRSEGMKFTQFYAGSTVCAPSRCVLLTGRHTGHCRVRGNQPGMLIPEDVTIAEMLQSKGYKTACIGKWGVGAGLSLDDPNQNGFNDFFGYVSMWHAHNFYPEFLIRNGQQEPLKNLVMPQWKDGDGRGVAERKVDYAPELLTREVLRFIDANKASPFFLYYALNVPHTNNEGGRFNPAPEKGMEVPDFGPYADQAWPAPEKGFAAMMRNIHLAIERIMAQLQASKIDDNTIVLLTSDNGPHQEGGHKMEFFNSNSYLRGMKRDLYEGGLRVPLIVRWPGKIKANSETDHLSAFQDLLPTFAEIAGTQPPKNIDGISFAPLLLGKPEKQRQHDFLYWEFTEQKGKRAIRQGDWKLIQTAVSTDRPDPPELFNLDKDPGEMTNVAESHPQIVGQLMDLMSKSHQPNPSFPLFPHELPR